MRAWRFHSEPEFLSLFFFLTDSFLGKACLSLWSPAVSRQRLGYGCFSTMQALWHVEDPPAPLQGAPDMRLSLVQGREASLQLIGLF